MPPGAEQATSGRNMKRAKIKVSVVVPVYNGSMTVEDLVAAIRGALAGYLVEIILVNDGSRDDSERICRLLAEKNRDVVFVSLRKNFGEHNAVMCGLNQATGDFAVIIDDDFQNPPDQICILLDEIRKGYDVVYSKYQRKRHNWFKNLGSRINNRVADILLNKPRRLYLSSFKVIRREIVKYMGPFPYIDGLIFRVTDNIGSAWVEHDARKRGKSNYTLKKLISLYLNMFLNFSSSRFAFSPFPDSAFF
jgi:glycosyltransferase involved in cell wall biosynthesis